MVFLNVIKFIKPNIVKKIVHFIKTLHYSLFFFGFLYGILLQDEIEFLKHFNVMEVVYGGTIALIVPFLLYTAFFRIDCFIEMVKMTVEWVGFCTALILIEANNYVYATLALAVVFIVNFIITENFCDEPRTR